MTAAHHLGPWAISNPVQTDSLTIQCQGVTLATIDLSDATGDDLARLLASAKVIRAAPELLEALQVAVMGLEDFGYTETAKFCRAAIAQARGQA